MAALAPAKWIPEKASGVKFMYTEKGRAVYELQSGHYVFNTK